MPITRGMLPEVLPAGSKLGKITATAAIETGIPEGLTLIASGSDKACEVLGTGCTDAHTGSLSYGSLATINICLLYTSPSPRDVEESRMPSSA